MMTSNLKKENTAMDYLGYALYAFGGLGIEILLMMIESKIWDSQSNDWTLSQNIMHWMVTCIIWGIFALVLVKDSIKVQAKLKDIHWVGVGCIVISSIALTSYVWQGCKPAIELNNLGALKFIVQYIYYAFESMLIVLIIAHGQIAFEKFANVHTNIPAGGILLAMTWGVIHVVTQGISTGIYTCLQSLLFGIVYMVLKKDLKLSYVAIAFMFML